MEMEQKLQIQTKCKNLCKVKFEWKKFEVFQENLQRIFRLNVSQKQVLWYQTVYENWCRTEAVLKYLLKVSLWNS